MINIVKTVFNVSNKYKIFILILLLFIIIRNKE